MKPRQQVLTWQIINGMEIVRHVLLVLLLIIFVFVVIAAAAADGKE